MIPWPMVARVGLMALGVGGAGIGGHMFGPSGEPQVEYEYVRPAPVVDYQAADLSAELRHCYVDLETALDKTVSIEAGKAKKGKLCAPGCYVRP